MSFPDGEDVQLKKRELKKNILRHRNVVVVRSGIAQREVNNYSVLKGNWWIDIVI